MKLHQYVLFLLFAMAVFPAFSYNHGDTVALPAGVTKLLPNNSVILASATADLNGDSTFDFVVVLQIEDTKATLNKAAQNNSGEPWCSRELFILTAKDRQYTVAARTSRAVLCSNCGPESSDPFLNIRAATKSFTILHKFNSTYEDSWGIASKFAYSRRDNKWQLVYFSGGDNSELKPKDFGLINLEDFDIGHYMSDTKVEVWPDKGPAQILPDDILYTDHGVAYVIRPDGSNQRYVAGDRYFCKLGFPNLSRVRKQIAFVQDNDMYVIGTDGRGKKKLFSDVIKISRYDYQRDGSIYSMKWSPDGKLFALTGQKDNSNKYFFYLREYNGATRMVKEYDTSCYLASFCWSPDSKKLAYYKETVISILDVETGSEKPLLINTVRGDLAWSGDGKKLLTVNDIREYLIVDAQSGSMRVIRCSALSGKGLFWSADEKYALNFTTEYVSIMPVEEYGVNRVIVGGQDAQIDGLYW